MRAEHRMSYSEADAFTGWRHVLAYIQRAGVRKKTKRTSHRKDRQIGRHMARGG